MNTTISYHEQFALIEKYGEEAYNYLESLSFDLEEGLEWSYEEESELLDALLKAITQHREAFDWLLEEYDGTDFLGVLWVLVDFGKPTFLLAYETYENVEKIEKLLQNKKIYYYLANEDFVIWAEESQIEELVKFSLELDVECFMV